MKKIMLPCALFFIIIQIGTLACKQHGEDKISGRISYNGEGFEGVTVSVNLDDEAPVTTLTQKKGEYSFKSMKPGVYKITPSLPGYSFDPESKDVTVADASVSHLDFNVIREDVTITRTANFAVVVMDYSGGLTHREMGRKFAEKIIEMAPEFEARFASTFHSSTTSGYYFTGQRLLYLLPQIPQEYLDEINGMAEAFSKVGEPENPVEPGKDNELSFAELLYFSLIGDVARSTACSAISVLGSRSASGHTMSVKVDDWAGPGPAPAVFIIKEGNKSTARVGTLISVTGTIIKPNGLFATFLDSTTGVPYPDFYFKNKRSTGIDLRYAMENFNTMEEVAAYLNDPNHEYTLNYNLFLSDPNESKVLESNISGKGSNMRRELRSANSVLNPGVEWEFPDAIACVNSFLLDGNHDNHTLLPKNTERWASIKSQLQSKGSTVTLQELKEIATYYKGNAPDSHENGDLYIKRTWMISAFQPDTLHLEVFFPPFASEPPLVPVFTTVPLRF